MLRLFGRIAGAIISSTFVSAIMFLIFFSIITHRFPPDFSQLQKTFQGIKELESAATRSTNLKNENLPSSAHQDRSDIDVENLEALNHRRAEVGNTILNQTDFSSKEPPRNETDENLNQQLAALKLKVSQLEVMMFKLQGHVDRLESRLGSSD
jgi:hypothetical protein